MKKYYMILFFAISCVTFLSCGDFLQEYSRDLVYASSCTDLDEIMIGDGYMQRMPEGSYGSTSITYSRTSHYFPHLHVMDDDVEEFVSGYFSETSLISPASWCRNLYTWQEEPFMTLSNSPIDNYDYARLYKHIGYLNVIISYVKEFQDDPEELRRRVLGEALFLRGAYYYLLVNLYAKPFSKETADSDLGVSLNLTEYIEDKHFSRDPVSHVYKQIVKDLKGAAENLAGIKQPTIYRADEQDARLLLSRVYLYMGEWQLAIEECDKIIEQKVTLYDFNELARGQVINTSKSPEIFFTQGSSSVQILMTDDWMKPAIGRYRVSDELYNLYFKYADQGVVDLRANFFFKRSEKESGKYLCIKGTKAYNGATSVFDAFVMRAAEVYLNKAEAQAMLDQTEAKNTIKILMDKRFAYNQSPNISNLSGQELVNFIREERRRELCFEGHRWFDLRRYAVSPKYSHAKEIVHKVFDAASSYGGAGVYKGTYVLKPYPNDNAWVLPIPDRELVFNEGVTVDNEKREMRTMIGNNN